MGDVRFDPALGRVTDAQAEGALEGISPETGVKALGALAGQSDPVLANVLATRLLNQFRRSATLLQFVGEGVVALDDEGRVLFANPAAERILGWRQGGLLGKDFHEAVDHRCAEGRRIHRKDCPILHPGARRQGSHELFHRRNGSSFPVDFVSASIRSEGAINGVAVVFRDVSERAERSARLVLHATALNNVPVPVFWLDREGAVLYVNRAAEEHLGRSREELVNREVFDFDLDFSPEVWPDHWRRVAEAGQATFASRHRRADGEVVAVRLDVAHVSSGGTEFHVAVVQPIPG